MFSVFNRKVVLGTAFAVSCSISAFSDDKNTYDFRVKRAPISEALFEFSKQSGVSISLPRLSYRDGKTRFLIGKYGVEEGLERLLQGTNFTYKTISPKLVKVVRKPRVRVRPVDVPLSIESDFMPVQEILISSLRRVDAIRKVPYAVSAITGGQQEHLRAQTTGDIAHRISSIYVSKQGIGKNKITIRGFSDGAFAGRAQSVVSTYQDNTRLTYNAPEPGLRLIDIDRVEVLRGPQGTLYGSGALSGLYRVVNREPNADELELQTTASYAWKKKGDPVKDVTGIINIPIADGKLALRAVAYLEDDGGYIDDERLKITNTNKSDTVGGRAAIKFWPTENWNIVVGGSYQEYDADDANYYNGKRHRYKRVNYVREPYNDKFRQVYATVNADIGWADLTANVSWLQRNINKVWDGSLAVPKLVGLDVVPSPFSEKRNIKTFTSETHLSGKTGGRLEWLLGSFYSKRDDNVASQLTVPGASFNTLLGGTDVIYSEDLMDDLEEVAFFGELTYYLSEKLSVTGGLRWFDYNDNAVSTIRDIGINLEQTVEGMQRKSGVTPKFVVSYHVNDNALLYGQVSQGYRVGGTNLLGPNEFNVELAAAGDFVADTSRFNELGNYNSDKLTNVELGYKAQALDGDLTINSAVYYAKWKDIQSLEYNNLGLPTVDNVGSAKIYGAELDFLFRPTHRFEIQGNVSFSKSKITESNFQFGANVGDPLPGAPEFSAGLSGRYEFDIGGDVSAALSADFAYVGGATLLYNKFSSPKMDAYQLSNVRFSLFKGPWQLTLFVNNVFDNQANSFAFGNPFNSEAFFFSGIEEPGVIIDEPVTESAMPSLEEPVFPDPSTQSDHFTPLRPRTIGIELGWRF